MAQVAKTEGRYLLVLVQLTEREFSNRIRKISLLLPYVPQLALKTFSTLLLSLVVARVAITEGKYLLVHVQVRSRELSRRIFKNNLLLPHISQLASKTYSTASFTTRVGLGLATVFSV